MTQGRSESVFRQGFLSGVAIKASTSNELLTDEYDVIIAFPSWDSRCRCITHSTHLRAKDGVVFLFDGRDALGLRDDHDNKTLAFCRKVCRTVHEIKGSSTRTTELWYALSEILGQIRWKSLKSLKILVDLSTAPRFYALAILAACFKWGIASEVSFFYAEGRYPQENAEIDKHELFTSGGWSSVAIPNLQGKWDPTRKRAYVVSVGFEGSKTLRLISRAEPDRVTVLFPDPGVSPEYVKRSMQNNDGLFSRFGVKSDELIRAEAGNAISAWRALEVHSTEHPEEENIYYVCCGTKPHSLALGLRAFAMQYPAVLYIVPDSHKPVNVVPSGVYWRFDIRDVTSFN